MRALWLLLLLAPGWAQGVDLKSLVRESPSYQGLLLQEAQARLALEGARAALLPTLAPQGSYARTPAGQESLALGLGGGVVLLPWGPAQDGLRAAERAYQRALLDLKAQGNALFQTALAQYLEVHLAGLDRELAQRRLALREAQLRALRAQHAEGQATFLALLEAEAAWAQAQAEALQAELALSLAQARLEATLGRQVAVLPLPLPRGLPSLEEALAAGAGRPDVGRARLALEEAEALLHQARRDRVQPQVSLSLSGTGGGASLALSLNLAAGTLGYAVQYQPLGAPREGVAFQAQASLPLLSPAQDREVAARERVRDGARLALEAALQAAALDLRARHQALLLAQAQVGVAERGLAAAEHSLEVAKRRLEAGTGTALEVLQAEVGLLQARRTLEGARALFLQAYYALLEAMGEPLLGGEL
ncbi:TolC family protein [Thermus thermamylovorans]|uniref:TolC family protein n=1 Tax=Thermus thermamylovorans TaxID=2509362 RepID=A0A4Q9B5C9_9DEIN|nr:TolC family protein [Thermus thermamylovorans]TBH20806.1 TolC family protein [Thermus thermamylovorans]